MLKSPIISVRFLPMAVACFGVILYSSKAIFVKLVYRYGIEVEPLLLLRMGFSMPIYWFVSYLNFKRDPNQYQPSAKENVFIIFLGVIGYYLSSWFDFEGLKYIGAGLERLILFIYPTLVVIISRLYLKKSISKSQLLSIFITYIGLAIVFLRGFNFSEIDQNLLLGGSLVFACAFCYATYLVGSNKMLLRLGTISFTSRVMSISFLSILVHYIFLNGLHWSSYPVELYVLAFFMSIFSTIIPSYLITYAIKKMDANIVGIVGSIGPVSTIIMAVFILDEPFFIEQFLGGIIILTGILYMSISKFKQIT